MVYLRKWLHCSFYGVDYLTSKLLIIYGHVFPVDFLFIECEIKPRWFNLPEYHSWILWSRPILFNTRPVDGTQDSQNQEPDWGFRCHLEKEDHAQQRCKVLWFSSEYIQEGKIWRKSRNYFAASEAQIPWHSSIRPWHKQDSIQQGKKKFCIICLNCKKSMLAP